MKLSINPEWLLKMVEKEQNKILSVGGHVIRMAAEPAVDLATWSKRFPLKAMRKLKYAIPENLADGKAILSFFDVPSPEQWNEKWLASPVAFRQTKVVDIRDEAVAAWVREAEIVAGEIPLKSFSADDLLSSIPKLRQLTRIRVGDALTKAQLVCASAGVALVVVPELPGIRVSGCAKWLNDKHAMIALSMRYKSDDQLWYTFFHEIGHILLHRAQVSFVIDNAADSMGDDVVDSSMERWEEEADRFASETLVPSMALAEFLEDCGDNITNEQIYNFAEALGIGPGIVVGRLQHDGQLKYWQGNDFKQKLDWGFSSEEEGNDR